MKKVRGSYFHRKLRCEFVHHSLAFFGLFPHVAMTPTGVEHTDLSPWIVAKLVVRTSP